MKKLSLILLSIAGLAACNKTEIITVDKGEAIAFADAFVDNSTRSIDNTLNTSKLESFQVYGSVTWKEDPTDPSSNANIVNLYSNVTVSKGTPTTGTYVQSNQWWYDGAYTQYWIEGNAYDFAAIVNGTAASFTKDENNKDNMPLTISYNAAGQDDLLYAEYTHVAGATNNAVAFTFNHLLAKAQFTFVNEITTNTDENKYTYKVTDIKITNAYMDGTYNIANKSWAVGSTTAPVTFGNITDASLSTQSAGAIEVGAVGATASATSHNSMLLIPHTYENSDKMTISYTIETLLNGVVIDRDVNLTITPNVVELVAGHAYNFVFKKGYPGDPIMFQLNVVNQWDPATGGTDKNI